MPQLTENQRLNLECSAVVACIEGGTLTVEQALNLTEEQLSRLWFHGAFLQYIRDGVITVTEVLNLTENQALNISLMFRLHMIGEEGGAHTITFERALNLDNMQRCSLGDDIIRNLIRDNVITIEEALDLDFAQYIHLVTIHRRIDAGIPTAPVPVINHRQSTHNTAVHQSTSESATQLMQHYSTQIDGSGLANTLQLLKDCILKLDESQKNDAAKRCIDRLTKPNYVHMDPSSGVSTRRLLALTFLAISDDTQRMGSFEDALEQLVEGLYEIQRGYNLNIVGVADDRAEDRSICSVGTFNKLIEKLQGIHPACETRFMTPATAGLKLPIVVREEARNYLLQRANPRSAAEFSAFTRLITAIEQDGLAVIYNDIEPRITERMLAEFGCLYTGQTDPQLTALVEAGRVLSLEDLEQFQQPLQGSEGYQQYCSNILRSRGGLFFSGEQERLSAARHDSTADQEAYDQQYGLVLRS